jgi:serine O-acetyltransferase
MKSFQSNARIRGLATTLMKKRAPHTYPVPIKMEAQRFVDDMMEFLFPHLSEKVYFTAEEIQAKLVLLQRNLKTILSVLLRKRGLAVDRISSKFFSLIPTLYDDLWEDAQTIDRGDPASESVEEVVLAYPGFLAIAVYRMAHEFYRLRVPIFPRLLTEYAHQLTGIDIHPGATIGRSFFIDHGTGIVIGETARIGHHVKLYQGVTLGALSVDKTFAKTKRHPTIEDYVTIYAQAVILGGKTIVGHHSIIGGNVWLTESVPPYSTVYAESKIVVQRKDTNKRVDREGAVHARKHNS